MATWVLVGIGSLYWLFLKYRHCQGHPWLLIGGCTMWAGSAIFERFLCVVVRTIHLARALSAAQRRQKDRTGQDVDLLKYLLLDFSSCTNLWDSHSILTSNLISAFSACPTPGSHLVHRGDVALIRPDHKRSKVHLFHTMVTGYNNYKTIESKCKTF